MSIAADVSALDTRMLIDLLEEENLDQLDLIK